VRDDADIAIQREGFLTGHDTDSGKALDKRREGTAQMPPAKDIFNGRSGLVRSDCWRDCRGSSGGFTRSFRPP
jgi:hypothetical protein